MSSLVRRILFIIVVFVIGYIGWRSYQYFFDRSCPRIEFLGLADGGYYSGDILGSIKGTDKYKVYTIRVLLDDRDIVPEEKVNAASFERPLTVATKSMIDGVHQLRIEAIDGTYHRNKSIQTYTFNVDNEPLRAAFLRPESDWKVFQGRTFHLPFQSNKRVKKAVVKILSKEFVAVPESEHSTIYECFVPIDCEEPPDEQPFILEAEDFVGNHLTLSGKIHIASFPFKKQIIRKVNVQQFEEERKLGRSEKELYDLLQKITKQSPATKFWRGQFYVPLNMTAITCDFGVKRVSQERGCYIHAALDVIGLPKTVIWAPQDGIVKVKDRFEVTGNTIVIDHGSGIITLLCHLDKFADIEVGDKIRRGNPVGIMGKTGYATGEHLHWEMRVNNICVDPLQWTKRDF